MYAFIARAPSFFLPRAIGPGSPANNIRARPAEIARTRDTSPAHLNRVYGLYQSRG